VGGEGLDECLEEVDGAPGSRRLRWPERRWPLTSAEGLLDAEGTPSMLGRRTSGEFPEAEAGEGGGEDETAVAGVEGDHDGPGKPGRILKSGSQLQMLAAHPLRSPG